MRSRSLARVVLEEIEQVSESLEIKSLFNKLLSYLKQKQLIALVDLEGSRLDAEESLGKALERASEEELRSIIPFSNIGSIIMGVSL